MILLDIVIVYNNFSIRLIGYNLFTVYYVSKFSHRNI
jgi:hypothetical protein